MEDSKYIRFLDKYLGTLICFIFSLISELLRAKARRTCVTTPHLFKFTTSQLANSLSCICLVLLFL